MTKPPSLAGYPSPANFLKIEQSVRGKRELRYDRGRSPLSRDILLLKIAQSGGGKEALGPVACDELTLFWSSHCTQRAIPCVIERRPRLDDGRTS
jgi:hypothetical protein